MAKVNRKNIGEVNRILGEIDIGLAVESLEYTIRNYRNYDYSSVWPNDHEKAYQFRNEQIETARKTKLALAELGRL